MLVSSGGGGRNVEFLPFTWHRFARPFSKTNADDLDDATVSGRGKRRIANTSCFLG